MQKYAYNIWSITQLEPPCPIWKLISCWTILVDILKNKKRKFLPDYFIIDGHMSNDNTLIANEFNNYFANIGQSLSNSIKQPKNRSFKEYLKNPPTSKLTFKNISEGDTLKIINNLKTKKSSGHDGLSLNLLKDIKLELAKPITFIINQSLNTGIFPDKMKIAKITPIHKQNDETRIENYRPISLLPAISKIIERAIFYQITTYFNINKLFHNNQYGFRKEHSTELAALEVIDRITCNMDNGKIPFNIYLDLSKAFDTLDQNILIEKLKFYGLTQSALTLLKIYLHERKQYVQINDAHSKVTLTSCRVPQGSIIGPLLFIIYINDMALTSKYFKFIIYADDTTLMGNLNEFDINKKLSKLPIW